MDISGFEQAQRHNAARRAANEKKVKEFEDKFREILYPYRDSPYFTDKLATALMAGRMEGESGYQTTAVHYDDPRLADYTKRTQYLADRPKDLKERPVRTLASLPIGGLLGFWDFVNHVAGGGWLDGPSIPGHEKSIEAQQDVTDYLIDKGFSEDALTFGEFTGGGGLFGAASKAAKGYPLLQGLLNAI